MRKIAIIIALCICACMLQGCSITRKQYHARDVNQYQISATLNKDMTVHGEMQVSYINNSEDVLKFLVLNLSANGYQIGNEHAAIAPEEVNRAYPNGVSYGSIEIRGVQISDRECSYSLLGDDEHALKIMLHNDLFPREKIKFSISFTTKLAHVKHRLGYTENAINLGNWYPVMAVYENFTFKTYPYYAKGDPFYLDTANYNVQLTCDSKYIVAHTGELVNTELKGDTKTYQFSENVVRDFAIVLSEKFEMISKKISGVTLKYYYISDIDKEASLASAERAFSQFSQSIGKYDYANLSVVQTDFLQGGMEFSNLVYISRDMMGKQYQEVIVHEVAHQWWYLLIGNNQIEEAWLDEGLTEFFTAYCYMKAGDDSLMKNGEKGYRGYLRLYESFNSPIDTNMQRSLNEFTSTVEYVAMAYSKGQMLFENLYREVGEKAFMQGIVEYFNTYRHEQASKDKFIAAFSIGSQRNMEGYINGFLSGRIFV